MIVSDNGIATIEFPSNGSTTTDLFRKLKTLVINNNAISEVGTGYSPITKKKFKNQI